MNSTHAFELIQKLASTSSKKDKEALLKEFWDQAENTTFRYALLKALDPFITYGMSKMPKVSPGTEEFNEDTYAMLERLNQRQLTGNAAKQALEIELGRLNFESGELLKGIITGKLGAGVTADTVNKVSPGAIFVFKMCLASKFSDLSDKITEKQWADGVKGEVKADGVRGLFMQIKQFHPVSRNGLPLNSTSDIREEVAQFLAEFACYVKSEIIISEDYDECLSDAMNLDCELVEANDVFNDTVGSVRSKDESKAKTIKVKVIDVISQAELEAGKSFYNYKIRREIMEKFFAEHGSSFPNISLIPCFTFHSEEETYAKFEELKNAGEEGLIIKLDNGFWEQKRSKGWLKIKDKNSADLVIKSLEEGDANGKYKGLMGAAVCDYRNSKGETVEVKIGGGWSLQQRAELWSAFTGNPVTYSTTDNGVTTEHITDPEACENPVGWLIEVSYHQETKDGSLRHPNFVRRRTDKSPDEGQGV
ncbi:putative DNA ligase (ATP) [Vibrio phage vB_VpaS_1601]|uniref:putative DNA ligase (ATP) n=1 Tax=Vibrio phage SHOU24 TaxID=1414739 RepID=UPI0003ED2190|nr:putative DNA ligase (ATP) [Vibrio phage SHOU24]AHI61207.1 putative DNA ligase (ATP) [Vibrio phage SHOU24]WHM52764.1 putative DNA ligase (ATP) [Vibrio phage vB_VpaP_1601]